MDRATRRPPSSPAFQRHWSRRNAKITTVAAQGLFAVLRIISHGGSFLGYPSKLVRFPDQNFSICALANAGDLDLDGLCVALADKALAGPADRDAPSWAETFREDG